MIVHVHADASITLEDPDTFTAFSVRANGLDMPALLAAFASEARAGEGDHLWISIPRLHQLGEIHGGPDWRAGCDGMIEFATGKGWVDIDRQLVRAHLER